MEQINKAIRVTGLVFILYSISIFFASVSYAADMSDLMNSEPGMTEEF